MYLPSRICDVITLLFDTRFQFCFHYQIRFDVLYTFCYMFCTFIEFLSTPKKRDGMYPTTLSTHYRNDKTHIIHVLSLIYSVIIAE